MNSAKFIEALKASVGSPLAGTKGHSGKPANYAGPNDGVTFTFENGKSVTVKRKVIRDLDEADMAEFIGKVTGQSA